MTLCASHRILLLFCCELQDTRGSWVDACGSLNNSIHRHLLVITLQYERSAPASLTAFEIYVECHAGVFRFAHVECQQARSLCLLFPPGAPDTPTSIRPTPSPRPVHLAIAPTKSCRITCMLLLLSVPRLHHFLPDFLILEPNVRAPMSIVP